MRNTRTVAVAGFVLAAMACSAVPHDPPQNRKDPQKPTLWESHRSVLFPALRQFVLAPGTKAERQFVPVEMQKDGTCQFIKVPEGWFTWKDGTSEGRVIVLDQGGFRVLIELVQVADVEAALLDHIRFGQGHASVVLLDHLFDADANQVPRVVECAKYKGDTHFMEYRYFETAKGAICVELTVFDEPKEQRTLEHLLAHLRLHYGKYEGVCQQVEAAVIAQR